MLQLNSVQVVLNGPKYSLVESQETSRKDFGPSGLTQKATFYLTDYESWPKNMKSCLHDYSGLYDY